MLHAVKQKSRPKSQVAEVPRLLLHWDKKKVLLSVAGFALVTQKGDVAPLILLLITPDL